MGIVIQLWHDGWVACTSPSFSRLYLWLELCCGYCHTALTRWVGYLYQSFLLSPVPLTWTLLWVLSYSSNTMGRLPGCTTSFSRVYLLLELCCGYCHAALTRWVGYLYQSFLLSPVPLTWTLLWVLSYSSDTMGRLPVPVLPSLACTSDLNSVVGIVIQLWHDGWVACTSHSLASTSDLNSAVDIVVIQR